MKKVLCFCIFIALSLTVFAQKKHPKLTKEESAKLTQDQRVVYESDRKSKNGKKTLSMKKKVRIDKKQSRKSNRIKQPKRKD